MPDTPQPALSALLQSLAVIPGVPWFHISDPGSSALDTLAGHFGIHPLQVEDCRHRRQTPRLEEHPTYSFMVIKALVTSPKDLAHSVKDPTGPDLPHDPAKGSRPTRSPNLLSMELGAQKTRVHFEDFDIFLGHDYILTVDEGHWPQLSALLPRLTAESRLQTPDRIAHALVDAAVDQYLPALDRLGDLINQLEDRVIRDPTPTTLREIFRTKRVLLEFRRVATAMREAVNGLVRRYDAASSSPGSAEQDLRIYYRDVYDHIVRVIDFVETYRDLLTGSLDIYLSAVANRTNEVMKILTLWGTIALPLLIVTSFYGMNVKLPLQNNPHALMILGLLMGASGATILYFFWRKHWF
jgi:magnesium transporter